MSEHTFSHQGDQGYPSEPRESHWLPALRPDADADLSNDSHNEEEATLSSYPRISKSPHDDLKSNKQELQSQQADRTKAHPNFEEENDKLDPAWGFKRTDSAQLLNGASRSPSFPKVFEADMQIASSQSLDDKFGSRQDGIDFNELVNGAHVNAGHTLENVDNSVEEMPVHVASNQPIYEAGYEHADNLDSRFEEGVPLIASSTTSTVDQPVRKYESVQLDPFNTASGDDDVESSFFSQLQMDPTHEKAHANLERKSTKDVIDSLGMTRDVEEEDFVENDNEQGDNGLSGEWFPDSADADTVFDTLKQPENAESAWAAAFDDDDEFLVEDADDLLPDSDSDPDPGSPSSFIASLKDDDMVPPTSMDQGAAIRQVPNVTNSASNPYAPHQPSASDMTQLSPKAHGNIGFTRPGLGPMGTFQNHVQQPNIVNRAESFADQAKGGYKSPYDLPMDLTKPKKRPSTQRAPSQSQKGVPPPPRSSSSMSSQKQLQSPFSPTGTTFAHDVVTSAPPMPASNRIVSAPVQPAVTTSQQPTTTSFFEELPMVTKPRPSGRYTPAQNVAASPPQPLAMSPPRQRQPSASEQSAPSPPRAVDPYAQYQLRPPERVDPYANVALQPPSLPTPSVSTNRYSPAPGAAPGAPHPVPSPRYSPVPPSQPMPNAGRYASQPAPSASGPATGNRYASQSAQTLPPANAALPFMPRTSSPLAYQGKPIVEQASTSVAPPKATQVPQLQQPPPRQNTPPQPSTSTFSPTKAMNAGPPVGFTPPRRSQTQSPGKQVPRSALTVPGDNNGIRPASAVGSMSVLQEYPQQNTSQPNRSTGRSRAPAPEADFEQPQDETRNDPLRRWRGAPIFRFGFGGAIVSSFPKHTPRYKAGQLKPQIKSTAGEVKTRPSKDLSLLPERVISFPGPLKSKSKKKDLLTWMAATIAKLEGEAPLILGASQTLPDPRKCHEELVLLWKVVRIFVEYDGVLDNKSEALKALNVILSPEVHAIDESTASQYRGDTQLTGIYSPAGTNLRSDAVDPLAVESLRKHLLKGEREQAVWKAADSRLWAHALLIASTVRDERKLWKQVVQEFVRQEVKSIGNNTESLSALYEVFGGNVEESIDQLVPPSARAGLQMVSRVDTSGPTKNALDGLDRWKETLSLVLNNRTMDDQRALATLGGLLANYGRIQAAHICFLFARNPLSPNVFGGVDDAQASITLLGSDRRAQPYTFHQDYDALLLTEAYEYAISVLAPASMSIALPHLSAYKFQRASDLADNGFKAEAQAYCDAIASGITSKAKVSPYYHASLLVEVDDLTKRLKQVPVQSTSWIAKPSVERATSSLLSKLSNFVAGDDSDAESKGSAADIGPFAKTSGTPAISRSGSQTDLYGSYPALNTTMPMTIASSRYAPGGVTSARSSTDLTRGRASLDSQRSPPTTSYGNEPRQSMYTPSNTNNNLNKSPARATSSYQQYGQSPSRLSYQPKVPQSSYMPDAAINQLTESNQEQGSNSYMPLTSMSEQPSYQPVQPDEGSSEVVQPAFGGYTPPVPSSQNHQEPEVEENATASYEQPQSYGYGYEPPADTGYVPYQPEPDSDDDKQKPKKKSFTNDTDDYRNVPSNSNGSDEDAAARRKANDAAAEAAFKAAAEADAQRAKEQAAQKKGGSGGGWLGGWFGGKKTDSLDAKPSSGAEPKVFKAKLGEDKMKLYYDKDLKKWVNPDDPDSAKAKSTPPPPPPGRSSVPPPSGGPPRAGGTPAPPMIGSRAGTPASIAGGETQGTGLGIAATLPPSVNAGLSLPSSSSAPPGTSSTPAPPGGGLAPPSRPLSNASSIDDLIGPPTGARKGAKGGRGAKKGRYVDVMAQ